MSQAERKQYSELQIMNAMLQGLHFYARKIAIFTSRKKMEKHVKKSIPTFTIQRFSSVKDII